MSPGSPHVVVALDSFEDPGIWRAAIDREWPAPRYASEARAVLAELDGGVDLLVAFPLADMSQAVLAAEARRRTPSCVVIGVAPRDTDGSGGCNDIVERGATPQVLVERARRCLTPPSHDGPDNEILETMPVGIAVLDAGGAFLFANRTLRDLIEVPLGAPIDRFHSRAFFWDRAAWEQLRATSRHGRRTTLLGVQTLSGRRCLLEVTAWLTRDGTTLLLRHAALEDQRERDLAEALSRSEERYRAIIEDQNDMVARSLPDGTLTYVNPATCRILGVPVEQLIGRNWHDFIPNREALRVAVERIESLDARQTSIMNDIPVRTATGEIRWYAWENRAVLDRHGRLSEVSAVGRDVTDRRRAEQELRESQTTLQSFYDGTPLLMGVAEVSDGKIVVVHSNTAAAQFFGTTPEQLAGGRPLLSFGALPEIHDLWLSQFDRSRCVGRSVRFDYVSSRSSGDLWLNATVSFLGTDERPRFSFVVQDETARRDVERRLAFHSDLLARVHDAVIATDESSRVTSWNAGAVQTFGWTEKDALSRPSDEVMPVELAGQTPDEGQARLIREGKYEGEIVYRRKDGSPFSAEVKSAILRGPTGDQSGVIISVRDVSRRKRAETALRESEGQLATLFREAPVGITITRLSDGKFLDVNPAFCALFGYARQEILGNTPIGLKLTEDLGYRHRMLGELAATETVRGRVTTLRTRAGEWRDCVASYGKIRLAGKECLVTILQDFTDRRRTEQQLERALGEREVLLREIHHRVKNNLQLLSSLMSFELSRGGMEVRQVAESLERRIHAMAVVHEHLYGAHDLSSLQADVYLGDLLRANLAAHGDAAARLTVSVEVAPLALSLDVALRVGLIVSELTSNALRHAFGHAPTGRLVLRLKRFGQRGFELLVRDNGVGIGAGAESQTATLGLRLVRQIARQLTGELACVSESGTAWTLRVADVE